MSKGEVTPEAIAMADKERALTKYEGSSLYEKIKNFFRGKGKEKGE